LVAGFLAAMTLVLVAAGTFVYWRVEYALDRGLNGELRRATTTIVPMVQADGSLSDPDRAAATGTTWQVLTDEAEVVDGGDRGLHKPLVTRLPPGSTATRDIGTIFPIVDRAPLRARLTRLDADRWLVVAVRRDHRDEALRELLVQLLLAGLATLVVTGLVGYLLTRSALAPVERYRIRAAEIAQGRHGVRLEVPRRRHDEVSRLGHTLNTMLASQERALERERHFVQDASHELRTPLAAIKARIQLARGRKRTVAEHERVLDELARDTDRLIGLSSQLLEQDSAAAPGVADAAEVIGETARTHALAAQGAIQLDLAEGIIVAVDAAVLARILTNLLDNAVRHGAPPVTIADRTAGPWAVITVADAGPGLDAELLSRATHRFARADEARSRPGSGLGLSLVERLVTEAAGELRLCFAGTHVSHGRLTSLRCHHDERMTATVVLPLSGP
jgi:signal transduction histidine kinase